MQLCLKTMHHWKKFFLVSQPSQLAIRKFATSISAPFILILRQSQIHLHMCGPRTRDVILDTSISLWLTTTILTS